MTLNALKFNFKTFRIKYDDNVKNKLPQTLLDMRKSLWEVPHSRDGLDMYRNMEWMTDGTGDFGFDSIANLELRKRDKINFAVFHEGNPANNLFFKVKHLTIDTFKTLFDIFRLTNCIWKVAKKVEIIVTFIILY